MYRGFDIGTDKLPQAERRGVPHHVIDIVDPTDEYTAADFARDASRTIREIHARGKLPLVVGGTGFYYRALTRGLFPGPGRDADLRTRLESTASRRDHLPHQCFVGSIVRRPRGSAARLKRIVRARRFSDGLSVDRSLRWTVSPIDVDIILIALKLPGAVISDRVTRRVDQQSASGLLDEI